MKTVNVHYQIITPESAESGDAAERGFEERREFDDTEEVIEFLRDEGATEPSSSVFDSHTWYSGSVVQDAAFFERGEERTLSYHLADDFSDDEKQRVFNEIVGAHPSLGR